MNLSDRTEKQGSNCAHLKACSDISSPIIPVIPNGWQAIRTKPPLVQSQTMSSHMGAESFDWIHCYSDDIYKHWRRIEQKRMIVKCCPNVAIIRPLLINILRGLRASYMMANTTLHLSIYILDNFLSRNSIDCNKIKLVAITALLVAAKIEDVEEHIPRFVELNQTMLDNAFTFTDYRSIEAKLLICLDFDLTIPTVATFANFFSRISVVLEDFHVYQQICDKNNPSHLQMTSYYPNEGIMYAIFEKYDEMLAAVNQLLQCLIDFTLDSVSFINVTPSLKAASCIAAARLLYNVQPIWTPFLEAQTFYSEPDIRPYMEVILSFYDTRISTNSSPESGRLTDYSDQHSNSIEGSPLRSTGDVSVEGGLDSKM